MLKIVVLPVCYADVMNLSYVVLDSTYPVKDLDESDTDSSGIVYHGTNVETESKE